MVHAALTVLISGLSIAIREISPNQTASTQTAISLKTVSHIPTKRATTPSAGAVGVTPPSAPSNAVCSGQALAEQGTQITVARLLWGFTFQKMRDTHGKEIDIDIFDYTNGLNWRPSPFECIIKPRNERTAAAIRREGERALQELEKYNGETKYRLSTFMEKAAKGLITDE
jgi:hypothetical protein